MSALKYWAWLSTADISVRTRWKLIDHFQDAEAVFTASDDAIKQLGISGRELEVIKNRDTKQAQKVLELCEQKGIEPVTINDRAYPERLKNISCPPIVLYVRGKLPELDANAPIALIGTRSASVYGLGMAKRMAYEMVKCGAILVSLVHGPVDEAALKGAMLADGCCVAVLGTPIDEDNRRINDIASKGAVISEIAPGVESRKNHFRDRNRIASGLSVGVLVVEAPEKSGTLLFCQEANEQGKEIFALPGNADSLNCAGSLALIKEGAKLVTCGLEVMEEFKALYPEKINLVKDHKLPEEAKTAEDVSQRAPAPAKAIDKPTGRGYIDLKEQLKSLNEDQLKIICAIEAPSSHIDDIIQETGFGAAKVLSQLTVLEIKGFVRRLPGRQFSVNTAKK